MHQVITFYSLSCTFKIIYYQDKARAKNIIIDLILNRKDGEKYNPKTFYNNVMQYGEIGYNITEAMDSGDEKDVKIALCEYIVKNGYNKNINYFIINNDWIIN